MRTPQRARPTWGGAQGGDEFDLPALTAVNDGRFATSLVCASCHSNTEDAIAMRDAAGRPVAPSNLWRATMMANSARDPFWWAAMRAEIAATPALGDTVVHECTLCHAPMAALRPDVFGGTELTLEGLTDRGSDRGQLGLDGVACASCHQIDSAGLGTEASYSGGVNLLADGRMFGPHADPFTMPMAMHTGFSPTYSVDIEESALCGSCHTLETTAVTGDGRPTGAHFLEQSPYLEWRNSAYTTEVAQPGPDAASCQACHMPSLDADGVPITTRIARRPIGGDFPPIGDRSPFHRHVFVGGNTMIPAILREFSDELRPAAARADFDAVIEQSRSLLRTATADVAIDTITREANILRIPVTIVSRVGHKFPSGYPSRRAWLRLEVRDRAGEIAFASGRFDTRGRIVGANGEPLAFERAGGVPEPHHRVVASNDAVQVYEMTMLDAQGEPTYRLLRAASRGKDNRILPRGFDAAGPHAERTAAVLAGADPDFEAGRDTVEYRVDAPAEAGPYEVRATLLYQSIGARTLAELFAFDAPEIRAFERMWSAVDPTPVVVAEAKASVGSS